MSKFCEQCGSELKDTDTKCPNCGAQIAEEPATKDVKKEETNTTSASNKKDIKTYAIFGGIAAAALVLIIILVAIFGGSGYKKPIDNMINGIQKANVKTFMKAFPDVMKEDLEDSIDKDDLKDLMEDLEDEVGKNPKISYKILDKEKIDKDDLKDVQEKLEDQYEDAKKSKVKVSAGYKLTVKLTIKGKDDSNSTTTTMKVYKIGGKWCMLSPSSSLF